MPAPILIVDEGKSATGTFGKTFRELARRICGDRQAPRWTFRRVMVVASRYQLNSPIIRRSITMAIPAW